MYDVRGNAGDCAIVSVTCHQGVHHWKVRCWWPLQRQLGHTNCAEPAEPVPVPGSLGCLIRWPTSALFAAKANVQYYACHAYCKLIRFVYPAPASVQIM